MKGPLPALWKDLGGVKELGGFMLAHARRRTLLALSFLLLGSLSEGLGILVLVPLLQLIGPNAQTILVPQLSRMLPSLFPDPPEFGLVTVLAVLLVLITLQSLFNRWKGIHNAELLYDIVSQIRTSLFASIGRARWVYVSSFRGSDLQHSVTADIDRINAACFYLLMLVQDVVLLAAYLALSCVISPAMTGFAFVTGALTLLALHPIRRKAARYGELLTTNRQEQYRTVSEFLTGMKFAKSFNAEGRFLEDLTGTLSRIRADFSSYLRLSSLGSVLTQVSGAIVLSVFVMVGLRVFKLQTAELIVLIYLFSRISPRFAAIQSDLQELLVNLPAFASVRRIEAQCVSERDEEGDPAPVPGLKEEMRFDAVDFHYGGPDARAILEGVTFRIPAGKVTALIGPSGSGKSTVADLMMGLLQPRRGTISVDGLDLGGGSRRAWRERLAYVPQEVFLLHDSVAANLAVGRPGVDREDMWRTLRAAAAEDVVKQLPGGLDAVVGDRGLRLSGGERQRIALARALLKQPSLLILDEATSALDWESQAAIARSIEALRGTMTIVTIAHRVSMIAFADWVVAFDGGRVVEEGAFAELVSEPGSRLARMIAAEH